MCAEILILLREPSCCFWEQSSKREGFIQSGMWNFYIRSMGSVILLMLDHTLPSIISSRLSPGKKSRSGMTSITRLPSALLTREQWGMQVTVKVCLFNHWITVPLLHQCKAESESIFVYPMEIGISAGAKHETISLRHTSVHAPSPVLTRQGCKTRTMYTIHKAEQVAHWAPLGSCAWLYKFKQYWTTHHSPSVITDTWLWSC